VRLIQEKHVCLQLAESLAEASIPALGWSNGGTNWAELCDRLEVKRGTTLDVLYRVRRNTGPYAGREFGGLELELCGVSESITLVS
jgi:hypothetical protein